ncbi:hypothetical protein GCM10020331_085010 [Ectobacillus funiculus]
MFTDGNRKEAYSRESKFHVTRKRDLESSIVFMKHFYTYPYPEKVFQHIELLTMPQKLMESYIEKKLFALV